MKKISSYIWDYRLSYLGAVLSLLIAVTLDMAAPRLTARVVDDVIVGGNMGELKFLLLGFLGVGLGRCIFQYVKEYTFDKNGARISGDMRRDLFRHIQSLSADFFDRTNTGELMARVKEDIDHIWDAVGYVGMLLIEVVYHTAIILVCMCMIHWKLAMISAAAMLLCGIVAVVMERKLGAVYEEISEENAVLNTVAEENLGGVRTVKAFAREAFEIGKFLSHNKRYYDLNMAQSKVLVRYYPIFTVITTVLPLLTLLVGGRFVIDGEMTLGQLTAFVEYSMNIVWPMEMLGWLTNSFSSAVASNKKIRKIYEETPTVTESTNPVRIEDVQGKVCFDHVSFHKADQHEILRDISFTVEAGGTLGIMGATGAGKTSIIQLLQRMYDATGGAIYLDGMDIRTLSLEQLRTSVGFVIDALFLSAGQSHAPLADHRVILLFHPLNETARLRVRGRLAHRPEIHIPLFPQLYVVAYGIRKQKNILHVARALSKKNPILVLDDSTSALDTETEQMIQQTLAKLENTTKIIIGHRISAVRHADEILVLEGGAIAERGTHEELLGKHGLYYETYLSQYDGVVGADGGSGMGVRTAENSGMEKKTGGETDVLQLV